MARWFKRRILSERDFSYARSWMIFFAILNLVNAALKVSEYQAESRVPLSAWGSMAISFFSALAAAYYQKRLDQARAIAGIMRDPDRDQSPKRQ
jgi:hypothetical protein